jgi:hypothetical protein
MKQPLEEKLKTSKKPVRTFVFDAWAHQGDPLRRTFLEKLIDWLHKELKWTTGRKDWNKIGDQLARRLEEVETTATPRLTNWGVVGALSLLVTPIALGIYQKIHFEWHPAWDAAALAASALPVLVAVTIWVQWRYKQRGKADKDREPLPNLIFTSTENKTLSRSSKTPDPTSVEFEKIYQELLAEVLSGNDRRVLFVIDNLDRVRHEDASSIWATLRVFFDPATKSIQDWRNRIWVLVPFDPEAIDDLWESGLGNGAADRNSASRHFLEKTFQATFRVPPVILTNWEKFLMTLWRGAFPNKSHSDEEFHTIYRLYDRLRTSPGTTPRNLKIFVNAVGALHCQWQDRVPLTHLAAFVLISSESSSRVLATAMEPEPTAYPSPAQTLNILLGEGWRRNLAAIYFNVEPSDAYQTLLFGPISSALQNGDGKALADLSSNPGFDEVLETVLEQPGLSLPIESDKVASYARAIACLAPSWAGELRCRTHLLRMAHSIVEWNPIDIPTADGINELVKMSRDRATIRPLVLSVCKSFKGGLETMVRNLDEWCKAISIILPTMVEINSEEVLRSFEVKCGPSAYLAIFKTMEQIDLPESLWRYIRPTASLDEINSLLGGIAADGNWGQLEREFVSRLPITLEDWSFDPLVQSLVTRVVDHPEPIPDDVLEVLRTLFSFSQESVEARTALETESRGEALAQLTSLFNQSGNLDGLALCTLPLLTSDFLITQLPAQGWSQNHPNWRSMNGRNLLEAVS